MYDALKHRVEFLVLSLGPRQARGKRVRVFPQSFKFRFPHWFVQPSWRAGCADTGKP